MPDIVALQNALRDGDPQRVLNYLKVTGDPKAVAAIDAMASGSPVREFQTNIPPQVLQRLSDSYRAHRETGGAVAGFADAASSVAGESGIDPVAMRDAIRKSGGELSVDQQQVYEERKADDPGTQLAEGNVLGAGGALAKQLIAGGVEGGGTIVNALQSGARAPFSDDGFQDIFNRSQQGVEGFTQENIAAPPLGLGGKASRAVGSEAPMLVPTFAGGKVAGTAGAVLLPEVFRFGDRVRGYEGEGMDRAAATKEALIQTGTEAAIAGAFSKLGLGGAEGIGIKQPAGRLLQSMPKSTLLVDAVARGAAGEIPEELIQTAVENTRRVLREDAAAGKETSVGEAVERAINDPRFSEDYTIAAMAAGVLGGAGGAPRGAADAAAQPTAEQTDEALAQALDATQRAKPGAPTAAEQQKDDALIAALDATQGTAAQEPAAPQPAQEPAEPQPAQEPAEPQPAQEPEAFPATRDINPEELSAALDKAEAFARENIGSENVEITRETGGLRVSLPGGGKIGVRIVTPRETIDVAAKQANAGAVLASAAAHGSPIMNKGQPFTAEEWGALTDTQRANALGKQGLITRGSTLSNPTVGDIPLNFDAVMDLTNGQFTGDTVAEEYNHFLVQGVMPDTDRRKLAGLLSDGATDYSAMSDQELARDAGFIERVYQEYRKWAEGRDAAAPGELKRSVQERIDAANPRTIGAIFRRIRNALRNLLGRRKVVEENPLNALFEPVRTGEIAGKPVQQQFKERPGRPDDVGEARAAAKRKSDRKAKLDDAADVRAEGAVQRAEAGLVRAQNARTKAVEQSIKYEQAAEEAKARAAELAELAKTKTGVAKSVAELNNEIQDRRKEQEMLTKRVSTLMADRDSMQKQARMAEDEDMQAILRETVDEMNTQIKSTRRHITDINAEIRVLSQQKQVAQDAARVQRAEGDEDAAGRKVKQIDEREKRVADEGAGRTFAVEPQDRALRATSPDARALEMQDRLLQDPVSQTDETTVGEATELLRGERRSDFLRSAEDKLDSGALLSDAEVVALKIIVADQSTKIQRLAKNPMARNATTRAMLRATRLLDRSGTEAGRALRQYRDPVDTPEGRREKFFAGVFSASHSVEQAATQLEQDGKQAEADSLRADAAAMAMNRTAELLEKAGYGKDALADSELFDDAGRFMQLMGIANVAAKGRQYGGLINTFLSQGLLTPRSVLSQIPSGAAAAAMMGGEKALSAAASDFLSAMKGDLSAKETRTLLPGAKAAVRGFVGAFPHAVRAFVTGESATLAALGKDISAVDSREGFVDPAREAFPESRTKQILTSPIYRMMAMVDEFYMRAGGAAGASSAAFKVGRDAGLDGKELAAFVERQMNAFYQGTQDMHPDVAEAGVKVAEDITFKRPFDPKTVGGGAAKGLENMRNVKMTGTNFRPFQAVFPFMRTGIRLAEFAGRRAPGTSFGFLINDLMESVGANKDKHKSPADAKRAETAKAQVAKQVASTMFGMGVLGMIAAGMGDDDEALEKLGKGEIGDLDLSRVDPGMPMAQTAAKTVQWLKGDREGMSLLNSAIDDILVKPTPFENVARMRRTGKPGEAADYGEALVNQLNRMAPFSGTARSVTQFTDARKREFTGEPVDVALGTTDVKKDVFGEDVMRREEGLLPAILEQFNIKVKPGATENSKIIDRIKGTAGVTPTINAPKGVSGEAAEAFKAEAGRIFLRELLRSGVDFDDELDSGDIKRIKRLRTKARKRAESVLD